MTAFAPETLPDVEVLLGRLAALEQQQKRTMAAVRILQELAPIGDADAAMRTVVRELGDTFGLSRCSIFLLNADRASARIAATSDDPGFQLTIHLEQYPELRLAIATNCRVHIPEVLESPLLAHVHHILERQGVRSITAVPMAWRGEVVGVIVLRTLRDGAPISEADIDFCETLATTSARSLLAPRPAAAAPAGHPGVALLHRVLDLVGEGALPDGQARALRELLGAPPARAA